MGAAQMAAGLPATTADIVHSLYGPTIRIPSDTHARVRTRTYTHTHTHTHAYCIHTDLGHRSRKNRKVPRINAIRNTNGSFKYPIHPLTFELFCSCIRCPAPSPPVRPHAHWNKICTLARAAATRGRVRTRADARTLMCAPVHASADKTPSKCVRARSSPQQRRRTHEPNRDRVNRSKRAMPGPQLLPARPDVRSKNSQVTNRTGFLTLTRALSGRSTAAAAAAAELKDA